MKIYFIFFLSFYVSLGAGFQMIPHSNSKIIEIKKLVQPSLRRHSLGNTGLFASRIGGTSVQSWTRFKYNWIANQLSDVSSYIQSKFSPPILLVIALLSFGLLSQSGNILASGKKVTQAQINIDWYGRVPFDDFLFTTARLTDPDLLKRSLPEAVSNSRSPSM